MAAVLLDSTALDACLVAGLEPRDFHVDLNKQAYGAMLTLHEEGLEPTIPALCYQMREMGATEPLLELDLTEMTGKYFTAVGVETHIRIVKTHSLSRDIIAEASGIAKKAYSGGDPVHTASEAIGTFSRLVQGSGGGFKPLGEANLLTFERGFDSGITVVDRKMRGILPGKLTVVSAPSGDGKSLMAAQICREASRQGVRSAIISLEMNADEYMTRMAHAISGVATRDDGKYPPEEIARMERGKVEVGKLPIDFLFRPRITRGEIEALFRVSGAKLLVLDYIQLVHMTSERQDLDLGDITSSMKRIAGEMQAHVIVLSQMGRGASSEMRSKDSMRETCILTGFKFPTPFIEAMKGSSSIEQDADHVIFIQPHPNCPLDHAEIVLAKNRGGPRGRGFMLRRFNEGRFHRMTIDECYAAARGDTVIAHQLLVDQGHFSV